MQRQPQRIHAAELVREKFFPYEYFQKRNADNPLDHFASEYKQKCNEDEDDPMQYVYMRIDEDYNSNYAGTHSFLKKRSM